MIDGSSQTGGRVATRTPFAGSALDPANQESDQRAIRQPDPTQRPGLPKGGGAIRGLGEKVLVHTATGAASLTVPIASSEGRAGFGPHLELSYDSAAGNGVFGFGFSLQLPAITRKTDKGLPRYLDSEESDVFILSGAEDLVPVLDQDGHRVRSGRTVNGNTYHVCSYQPRIEGLFESIERWEHVNSGISHWRSISRNNVITWYGLDANSRVADPRDPARVFSYLISRTLDDRGNLVLYEYAQEDGSGVDGSQAHEANRTEADRSDQRYIKRIRYAATSPYFCDWSPGGGESPLPTDWHFEVVFDYGDHGLDPPTPRSDRPWPVRPDPFSSYRAGFEVRTYRRCRRVLLFHHFPDEAAVGRDCLVRTTNFRYQDEDSPADPRKPIYTFLASVVQTGYRREGNGYVSRSMPPLEFEYSELEVQPTVRTLDRESETNLPRGIQGAQYQWLDLDAEGLPGVLVYKEGAWGYKRNLSPLSTGNPAQVTGTIVARFGPLEDVSPMPSALAPESAPMFLDLAGDGRVDMVSFADSMPGFFDRTTDTDWEPFRAFKALPRLDWTSHNVILVDVTGDGRADVLVTEDAVITIYTSLGEAGFGEPQSTRIPWNERLGPRSVYSDAQQRIFMADMSGDGLSDLVLVRNGEVSYWPNLGYGRFGAMVVMDDSPWFADAQQFDPDRIRLADVDGSGTADLIYIGQNGVQVSLNESGNSWSTPHLLAVFPTADSLSSVQVIDLLGTGTACLVWSSPLPSQAVAPMRYVDLMGSRKPHLLIAMRNNLGAETRLRYAPSTRFYLSDKAEGRPWVTRLPFVVHVVERIEVLDWIGRSKFATRYAYHHGFFDGHDREFRGFGLVEQWDTITHRDDSLFPEVDASNWDQASWMAPVLTRTWFHTGAFVEAPAVSRQYAHEYWVEPALRPDDRSADWEAMVLPDSVLPPDLTPEETREAYRSLKGMMVRTETYAEDGSQWASNPYSVIEQDFSVALIQHRGTNQSAVFFATPRESLKCQYERRPTDPRVSHELNLEVDSFGNVLRSISVGYPRRAGYPEPEPALTAEFRTMLAHDQTRMLIMGTQARFTNPVLLPDARQLPLPCETVVAELTGPSPKGTRPGVTNLFRFEEIDAFWQSVWDGAHDIPAGQVPSSDVDGSGPDQAWPGRRVVEQTRTLYRRDDLTQLYPLGQVDAQALPGESYRLALTPELVGDVFDNTVTDSMLAEGGYVRFPGDNRWWNPSGLVFYSSGDADTADVELREARAHFYQRRRFVDTFGAITRNTPDPYDLLAVVVTDAVGNVTATSNDYRVLQAFRIVDPNGNRAEAAFDALGLVVGTAVMGKTSENLGDSLAGFVADLDEPTILAHLTYPLSHPEAILGNASSRMLYDLSAYFRTRGSLQPTPPAVYVLTRDTHSAEVAAGQATNYQHSFAYSDGFAREAQRKTQAEPGPVADAGSTVDPRWATTGWCIYNNKGKCIRKYEPFFSATHMFEYAPRAGVSRTLFYDPLGRVLATLHPDNSWEKVIFDVWQQQTWDVNDTVLISDPRADGDIGDFFRRLLGSDPSAFASWYERRIGGTWGGTADQRVAEKDAAEKTAAHAATPSVAHFDALGRTWLSVADNGASGRYPTRTALDGQGRPLAVFDARGRRVFEYCVRVPRPSGVVYIAGYDLVGNPLFVNGMESGTRRTLSNVVGNPIRAWDANGNTFRLQYDGLQRLTHRWVSHSGAPEMLLERCIYGESMAERNLSGRLCRQYDTAGLASNDRYDFKGNLLESTRHLARDYHQSIDWSALATLQGIPALDAAAAPLLSDTDRFSAATLYDALSRPIQIITPHSSTTTLNVIRMSYNEASLLKAISVWLRLAQPPTILLDPSTADLHPVGDITYNARAQRTEIVLGNSATTTIDYEPETFRPSRIATTRPSSFPSNQRVVQDVTYTADPAGNITHIADASDAQNVVYFQNQRVDPSNDYTYDAIYRLIAASGREHLGQNAETLNPPQQIGNADNLRTGIPHPSDGNAMARYTESYSYDAVGNLVLMAHQVSSGSWTRRYSYADASQITPSETSNRLSATSLPGDPVDGPYSATYAYDSHGSPLRMPHLPILSWNEHDRLSSTTRQVVNAGLPETTYYTYDAGGQRLRKVTDRQAAASQVPRRKTERLYLGPIELYREYAGDGTTVSLQRESLHMLAGDSRVAMIETRTVGTDSGPPQLARYQFTNHLGSAILELDGRAAIISYEEYFPYGSTAYQAVRLQTETPKRYRYSGKERDEENDLYYYGARYYAPWLGRWLSCDPAGLRDGLNLYMFVRGGVTRYIDPQGLEGYEDISGDLQSTAAETDKAGLVMGKKPSGGELKALPKPQQRMQTAPLNERYEGNKGAARARTRAKASPLGAPEAGDEMAHLSAARHNKVTKIPNDIANDAQNIKAIPGKGKNATVTAPDGTTRTTDFHAAQEDVLDEIHARTQKGKTPGTIDSSTAAQDALEEAKIKSEPFTREHLNEVKNSPKALPEKGPPVDPKTGKVIVKDVEEGLELTAKKGTGTAEIIAKDALQIAEKEGPSVAGKGLTWATKSFGRKALQYVPFIGMGIGAASASYNWKRGHYEEAFWDGLSVIPGVGDVSLVARILLEASPAY